MKYFHILLLLLACSMIFSSKLSKFHRKHGHRSLRTRGAWDKIKLAIKGLFDSFDLVEAWNDFKTCKEDSGEMKKSEVKKQEEETEKIDSSLSKVWELVKKVIDGLCYAKDKIIDWLTGMVRRYRRRQMRLFMQGKKIRRLKGFFSKIWEFLTSGVSKIVGWVKDIGEFAGEAYDKVKEIITKQIKKVVKPVTDIIDDIKDRFEAWLTKHPWLLALYTWIKCIIKSDLIGKIKDAIQVAVKFVTLVGQLADGTGSGWIRLGVNLICNYSLVGQAVTFIKAVFSGDEEKRPFNLGKFIGYFMQAVVEK